MGFFTELKAKLSIDTSGFNSSLRKASSQANSFAKGISSNFSESAKNVSVVTDEVKILGKTADKSLKSVTRIVQGILISQAFYRSIHAIEDATKAIFNFNSAVEQTQVAFAGLLRDMDKGIQLTETLQDFAAKTPFEFEHAADNARKLLAYGFSENSIEAVLRDIADAAAAAGDPGAFDRITKALGQIQAKGRVTSREIVQLASAGIPAFEILQEELGLTREQINDLGREGIDAATAIPAILNGMQKRYKGAADAMSQTTRGLLINIKDNTLMILNGLFEETHLRIRAMLKKVSDSVMALKDALRSGGVRGLMQAIFPPEIFPKIQLFITNIRMLRDNIFGLLQALWPLIQAIGVFLLNAINMVLPLINALTRVFVWLAQIITSNDRIVRIFVGAIGGLLIATVVTKALLGLRAAIKSLFIAKVAAQAVIYLAKAIEYLAIAMMVNPWVTTLALATGGLVAFTVASKKAGRGVDKLGGKINRAFGYDPDKVFKPKEVDKASKATYNFNKKIGDSNNKLKDTNDKIKDVGKNAKKSGKKVKKASKEARDALMSFDEVFTLVDEAMKNVAGDPTSGAGGIGTPDLGDMLDFGDVDAPEIPPFDYDPMFPELDDEITDWANNIANKMKDKLKKALIGAGIGAMIGAVLGYIFGGLPGAKLGAKIGAGAGAIVGFFWDELKRFFSTSEGLAAGIGAIIGGIIGTILMPGKGTAIGAAIGAGAGYLVAEYWDSIKEKFMSRQGLAIGIGAVIGGIIGTILLPGKGTAIGAAIGAGAAAVVEYYWDSMIDAFKTRKGASISIGAVIGAILGTLLLPGKGTVLGASIGIGAGHAVDYYWDTLKDKFSERSIKALGAGAALGASIGTILMPGPGTAIGTIIGSVAGLAIEHYWDEMENFIYSSQGRATGIGAGIGAVLGTLLMPGPGTIIGAVVGGAAGKTVSKYWDDIKNFFSEQPVVGTAIGAIIGAILGSILLPGPGTVIGAAIGGGAGGAVDYYWDKLKEFFSEPPAIGASIGAIVGAIIGSILFPGPGTVLGAVIGGSAGSIVGSFWEQMSNYWQDKLKPFFITSKESLDDWREQTETSVREWRTNTILAIDNWWTETAQSFAEWAKDSVLTFINWKSDTVDEVSEWSKNTLTGIRDWIGDTVEGFDEWSTDTFDKLSTWFENTKSGFKDWYTDTSDRFSNWWSNTKQSWGTWDSDTGTRIRNWWSNTKTGFRDWSTDTHGRLSTWFGNTKTGFSGWSTNTKQSVSSWYNGTKTSVSKWATNTYSTFSKWWSDARRGFSDWTSKNKTSLLEWARTTTQGISRWWTNLMDSLERFWSKLKFWERESERSERRAKSRAGILDGWSFSLSSTRSSGPSLAGHAKGGIFNKEHIARFAEGNKMEAILPVEDERAMSKVRRAIFGGEPMDMISALAEQNNDYEPSVIGGNEYDDRRPLYVGTLIADERGLRELERKLYNVRLMERQRRGNK